MSMVNSTAAAATRTLIQKLGKSVKDAATNKSSRWWYTPHMAAASRAVADRIPLADLVVEVRDARIPLSSKFHDSKGHSSSSRHIIVLNKADLANQSELREWITYFAKQNSNAFGVDAHNEDSVKKLLLYLQTRVREMIRTDNCGHTATVMLVGIPNVGKSALAYKLHLIGRIKAAEKGKLKRPIIGPNPGETKNITGLKIASHPNIYVLDTPGILPPEICSEEVCSKLALTGAIEEEITENTIVAQYFLAILNQSGKYKIWEKYSSTANTIPYDIKCSEVKQRIHQLSDHTQDMIMNKVKGLLYEAASSFRGNLGNEKDMMQLIEAELNLLESAFHVAATSDEMAGTLLDLYRTGRLGHYTHDSLPTNTTNY